MTREEAAASRARKHKEWDNYSYVPIRKFQRENAPLKLPQYIYGEGAEQFRPSNRQLLLLSSEIHAFVASLAATDFEKFSELRLQRLPQIKLTDAGDRALRKMIAARKLSEDAENIPARECLFLFWGYLTDFGTRSGIFEGIAPEAITVLLQVITDPTVLPKKLTDRLPQFPEHLGIRAQMGTFIDYGSDPVRAFARDDRLLTATVRLMLRAGEPLNHGFPLYVRYFYDGKLKQWIPYDFADLWPRAVRPDPIL